MNSKTNTLLCLIILNLVTITLFGYVIYSNPQFIGDDFIYYTLIKETGSAFSTTYYDPVILMLRPVSSITFYLDSIIFKTNSLGIKYFSLFIHLCFINLLFFFLNDIVDLLQIKVNKLFVLVLTLLYSSHSVTIFWIDLINNRTELMLALFYLLTLFLLLKYYKTFNLKYLYIAFVTLVLAILSKQQSLHLPVAITMLIIYYRNKFDDETFIRLRSFAILGLIFAGIYLSAYFFNSKVNPFDSSVLSSKPFSIVGNVLFTISPLYADYIYDYFLKHRLFTVITTSVLLIVFVIVVAITKTSLRRFGFWILFAAILYLPRAFAESGGRVNSVQLIWFLILIIFSLKYLHRSIIISATFLLMFTYSFDSYIQHNLIMKRDYLFKKQASEFVSYLNTNKEIKPIVICGYQSYFLPYLTYFERYKTFGKDNYTLTPLFFRDHYYNSDELNLTKSVEAVFSEKGIDINSLSGKITMNYLTNSNTINSFEITNYVQTARGYEKIQLSSPDNFSADEYTLLYYNGEQWSKVK